jgi:hypothetical protein
MAARIITSYGEPDLMDRTIGLTRPLGLDALETLKAVQGIINTYLANAGTDGRSTIPTPEPSPVQMPIEHGKRELVGMDECQDDAIHAGQMQEKQVMDIVTKQTDGVNASQFGINNSIVTNGPPQNSPTVCPVAAANLEDFDDQGSPELTINLASKPMGSNAPVAHQVDGGSMANGSIANASIPGANSSGTLLPPAVPISGQDHLVGLARKITHTVSQVPTDDAARIKVATAALELAAAVRPPSDTIMGWFANMSVISAVRLFLHWGAFDIIPSGKGETITYAELAQRIRADEGLIGQYHPTPNP